MIRAIHFRAPKRCSNRLLGNFKNEIAEIKDAVTQVEHRFRQAEVILHSQSREAKVGTVQNVEHIQNADERNEPPGDLSKCSLIRGLDSFIFGWSFVICHLAKLWWRLVLS